MNEVSIQSSRETPYFILGLIFSMFVYVFAAFSVVGIGIALIVFAVLLLSNLLSNGSIRGNGVRINEHQFGDVYARTVALSKEMGLKKTPDMFVIQAEGMMNAFATRFWGKNMILITSDVFDLAREAGEAELDFIIAHELAHVKRNHVWKNILVTPARFIPFLSEAYSRSCEYTCDRSAAFFTQNPAASKRALAIFGVGKRLSLELNEDLYRQQIETESNGAVWLSEVLSTHPTLPKRIQSIAMFSSDPEGTVYHQRGGTIALGVGIIIGVGVVIYVAFVVFFAVGMVIFTQFLDGVEESFSDAQAPFANSWSMEYEAGEGSELFEAVMVQDLTEAEAFIQTNEYDLNETDEDGNSLLYHATYFENVELVERLLEAGADPNDYFAYDSPLMEALYYDDYETALLLLEYGADPMFTNANGETPLSISGVETEEELMEKIEEYVN